MSFEYPVFLDLGGVRVLVVGAGPVALRKAQGLIAAGAVVTVVAPAVVADFDELSVTLVHRAYEPADIVGHRLVVTATSDTAVNAQVAVDATAAGVWVNSADDPTNCSFILPAIARRGAVSVAVSTGGASPALARRLRDDIAATVLTAQVAAAATDLARQRAEVHAAGASTEATDWSDRVQRALHARDATDDATTGDPTGAGDGRSSSSGGETTPGTGSVHL